MIKFCSVIAIESLDLYNFTNENLLKCKIVGSRLKVKIVL